MLLYRLLWALDLIAIGIVVVLLYPEVSRERFDSDSAAIYLPIVGAVVVLLGSAYALHRGGNLVLANLLLIVLGVPAALFATLLVALTLDPIAFR